ncbi:MAG: NRDE family protein [Saezia sp.]
MCLILIAWQSHPDYPLVIAANRDEFFSRPSAPLAAWQDAPHIFSGRDLEAGGTWLGITQTGRFAAITNVREPGTPLGAHSRGQLTRNFLLGQTIPESYVHQLHGQLYSGFNLLVGDETSLFYTSNREPAPQALPPGIYAVSNHRLNTPWPKLTTAKTRFSQALKKLPCTQDLFTLLADNTIVPDDQLPRTGVSLEWERTLSAIFVHSPNYGTRASTVFLRTNTGTLHLTEHSFDTHGKTSEVNLHNG